MDFIPEFSILAVLLGIIVIYLFTASKYKRKKTRLLAKYRRARSRSLYYQDKLSTYILKNDAQNEIIIPGITYGQLLKELQKHHSAYLSEKRYKRLRRNPILIGKNEKVLQMQEQRLKETEEKISVLKEKCPV
ncbi:hypothetical protein DVK85_00485 [Flavobacterium arcticum]|uniref:Uncharacterized protein n=1 Tax=Flavobacterium arcticum TaxID=1784713 RepID=A0A345H878_9FLAO|nr:hypothetical protein [Flavobacterium arcticum]AXG72788.1 hypothetical protein DVK85_00485 [Flavobacterium arcticum]KAF2510942.1 hypothetical protein E0W72_05980 [Flavobacterium arcticum]